MGVHGGWERGNSMTNRVKSSLLFAWYGRTGGGKLGALYGKPVVLDRHSSGVLLAGAS